MSREEFWFVTDLHGKQGRYTALFRELHRQPPDALLMGGDLMPHRMSGGEWYEGGFLSGYFRKELKELKKALGKDYPGIYAILGNDDARTSEDVFREMENEGLLYYISMRTDTVGAFSLTGYPFVPPTPFLQKDWEKYDVSRFVDPGSVHPTEGFRTVAPDYDPEYSTIKDDLEKLAEGLDMTKSIFLFHSPPYQGNLDRAALDGRMVDHVPLDVNVGSIAIRRFIEENQPRITLHGHVHESSALTGEWREREGETWMFGAAWSGPELCIIKFDPGNPAEAGREILL